MRRATAWMMITIAIPATGLAQQQGPTVNPAAAAGQCARRYAEQQAFSGVIAGKIGGHVFSIPRGTMGAPGSGANGADTRFNLGSASKMFTAVAVAQLVDTGAMRLDDPIGQYVPELASSAAKAVTIRQLLTHSGGFGSFFRPDALPALQAARKPTDLMPLIRDEAPAFAPGSASAYSNTGFALLGIAVERASKTSYDAYLAEHVFVPAGMTRTGYAPGGNGDRALGMTSQSADGPPPPGAGGQRMMRPPPGAGGGLLRLPPPPGDRGPPPPTGAGPLHVSPESALFGTPAGGAYSTGGDLIRFFEALAGDKLIKPETRAAFTTQQIISAPAKADLPALYYGFGFGVGAWNGHRWFGHNGGAPGLNVEAISFPDDGVILVVLANRDPPSATQLFRALRPDAFAATACGPEKK